MEEPVDELTFPGFPLGLDTTTAEGELGPNGARVLLGMTPDFAGGLRHAGNFRTIVPNTYHAFAFLRWSFGTADRLLFITTDVAGTGLVYVWDEVSGALDRTITVSGLISPAMTIARFLQAGISGEVYLLVGGEGTSHLFQIPDPLTSTAAIDVSSVVTGSLGFPDSQPFSVISGGVGELNSTGYSRYQWSITLNTDTGRESQLSFPSPPLSLVNEKGELHFGPNGPLEAEIQAGRILSLNLFRIGGKASQFRRVATYQLAVLPIAPGLDRIVDAITGTFIIDNVKEEELSFIFATTYQDPAPVGLTDIILHQNKIFGIKGTGLYGSRTNNFLYWGYDDNGVDDDGFVIYPDNNTGDAMNGLSSEGSLLTIGREQSTYTLYGSSLSDGNTGFAFDKRSTYGNQNRLSIIRSDNETFTLGRDDAVRSLGDKSSPVVSGRIEKTLKAFADTDIQRAVMGHHNGGIYVSIPIANAATPGYPGRCFVYESAKSFWREATDSRLLSNYLTSQPNPVNGELELMSASRSGGIFACETYNDGTAGTERKVRILTDKLEFPPEIVGRFASILVMGTMVNSGTDPLMATLTAGSVTKTYPLVQSGRHLLYYTGLPPDLVGDFLTLEISGSISAGEIRGITIGTLEMRRMN